jgi:hypothetical protein
LFAKLENICHALLCDLVVPGFFYDGPLLR